MDTWTKGEILSLNCFPMVAGYYVALERTLFCETATKENLPLWECSDIAKELTRSIRTTNS